MVGQFIRQSREDQGMTQEEVALRAGIDRSYLSEIERDRKNPTVDMFMRLCRAMEVPAATIIEKLDAAMLSEKPRSRRKT